MPPDKLLEQELALLNADSIQQTAVRWDLIWLSVITVMIFIMVLIRDVWRRKQFLHRSTSRGVEIEISPMLLRNELLDHYSVLGCKAEDPNEEIKRQYKRLVQALHSDKLQAHDLPEEVIQVTNERFRKVQAAYRALKELRGF